MERLKIVLTITDKELIQQFKEDCIIRGLSAHTLESYISILNMFATFLKQKGRTLITLERETLRDYIAYLRKEEIDQKTIENRFSAISSCYEYLVYEKIVDRNVVKDIQKRYLKTYKINGDNGNQRKLININEMAQFISSIFDTRDKAMALLFAKTGIRRRELVSIDIDDINWDDLSITLKPTHKRSNRVVFFDHECAMILKRWINKRESIAASDNKALFISYNGGKRLDRSGVYNTFIKWATNAGLHNPKSKKIEDHFTCHCCRHWFTTFLRRAGMEREHIMELRGDIRDSAMDLYYRIDREELKKSYLAHIPQLGLD